VEVKQVERLLQVLVAKLAVDSLCRCCHGIQVRRIGDGLPGATIIILAAAAAAAAAAVTVPLCCCRRCCQRRLVLRHACLAAAAGDSVALFGAPGRGRCAWRTRLVGVAAAVAAVAVAAALALLGGRASGRGPPAAQQVRGLDAHRHLGVVRFVCARARQRQRH
jgi:hypothetical protein